MAITYGTTTQSTLADVLPTVPNPHAYGLSAFPDSDSILNADTSYSRSLWDLTNHLRYLTRHLFFRGDGFTEWEGELDWLPSGAGTGAVQMSLSINGVTHDDGGGAEAVTSLIDWIDLIRSEFGVPAWTWSFGSVQSFDLHNTTITEVWNAAGLIHSRESSDLTVIKFIPPDISLGEYIFSSNAQPLPPRNTIRPAGRNDHAWRLPEFADSTRISGVETYFLFRHNKNLLAEYTGNSTITLDKPFDISTATLAWNVDAINDIVIQGGMATVANDTTTGASGSFRHFDVTAIHPTSGSGDVVYRMRLDNLLADGAGVIDTVLWQPHIN